MLRRRLLSMRRIDRPPQAKKIWGLRRIVCTLITVGASWPQAVHGRLSRCKRLPLILDRASTPAWLATLRPVRPPGSELRLLPNQSGQDWEWAKWAVAGDTGVRAATRRPFYAGRRRPRAPYTARAHPKATNHTGHSSQVGGGRWKVPPRCHTHSTPAPAHESTPPLF